jgi:hypothetical protein
MPNIESCGHDEVTGRNLFMVELATPTELPSNIRVNSKCFGALIAWDARGVSATDVEVLLRPLIDGGCVYFVCWGPDCERVHDTADECDPYANTNSVIMTTWHNDESLDDAIWYFLNTMFPDPAFEEDFHSSLAITIGSPSWASAVRAALLDPRAFSARVLATSDV